MNSDLSRISFPELFFGFVAPIGVHLEPTIAAFRSFLESHNYRVEEIKVTDVFKIFARYVQPMHELKTKPLQDRLITHIRYGNQLRTHFSDDSILANTTIATIVRRRNALPKAEGVRPFEGTAYLLRQFKRKEEIELLRSVYGRLFFQVSVYSRRGSRVDSLARRFASSKNFGTPERFRAAAEDMVQTDEDEVGEEHGQRVAKIFHDGDLIVTLDSAQSSVEEQVNRFCEILFSSNSRSPTKSEYGMFAAKAAALRTLDLSRQVGAAIFSADGEIVSFGSNEVPKAEGGAYWTDSRTDARDFRRGVDPNFQRKKELLAELIQLLGVRDDPEAIMLRKDIRASQFMDALEYGRVVHAEMSALCDAARIGRPTKGGTLYCTTFPCHMCAKHIVAAGLSEVVFLEPYPKSMATSLHPDSILVENADRGEYAGYPAVRFEHFFGITPRRYRELFERGERKDTEGNFVAYASGRARPLINIKFPFYFDLEMRVLEQAKASLKEHKGVFDEASQ